MQLRTKMAKGRKLFGRINQPSASCIMRGYQNPGYLPQVVVREYGDASKGGSIIFGNLREVADLKHVLDNLLEGKPACTVHGPNERIRESVALTRHGQDLLGRYISKAGGVRGMRSKLVAGRAFRSRALRYCVKCDLMDEEDAPSEFTTTADLRTAQIRAIDSLRYLLACNAIAPVVGQEYVSLRFDKEVFPYPESEPDDDPDYEDIERLGRLTSVMKLLHAMRSSAVHSS